MPEGGVENACLAGAVDLNARWHREPNRTPWGSTGLTAKARDMLLDAFGLLARLKEGSLAVREFWIRVWSLKLNSNLHG